MSSVRSTEIDRQIQLMRNRLTNLSQSLSRHDEVDHGYGPHIPRSAAVGSQNEQQIRLEATTVPRTSRLSSPTRYSCSTAVAVGRSVDINAENVFKRPTAQAASISHGMANEKMRSPHCLENTAIGADVYVEDAHHTGLGLGCAHNNDSAKSPEMDIAVGSLHVDSPSLLAHKTSETATVPDATAVYGTHCSSPYAETVRPNSRSCSMPARPLRPAGDVVFDPLRALQSRLCDKLLKRTAESFAVSGGVQASASPAMHYERVQCEGSNTPTRETQSTPVERPHSSLREGSEESTSQLITRENWRGASAPVKRVIINETPVSPQRKEGEFSLTQKPPVLGTANVSRSCSQGSKTRSTQKVEVGRTASPMQSGSRRHRNCSLRPEHASHYSQLREQAPLQVAGGSSHVGRYPAAASVNTPLPRQTAPQRTVLDVLTGAEFFALMRLRGVIVSRGDTGEYLLPETHCHSVYLTPTEHKQLLQLRAKLRMGTIAAKEPRREKAVHQTIEKVKRRSAERRLY
ncbi:hypothetical protein TRVL_03479 [Trypanosoma vivax]|nr:hypothetical protein TRVL_03479 [Trypanosoma vivax]